MSGPSAATPGSTADSGTPAKTPAVKNKSCPFCGDTFTSSSLGRHLDLYIKDKNPKTADGVHDADQIRNMRQNITRRQPRRSSARREGSTPASNRPSNSHNDDASPFANKSAPNGEARGIQLNKPTWHATGVITDLQAASREGRFTPSRKGSNRLEISYRKQWVTDRNRARAAELALQEVLDSVKAALAQTSSKSPFEFDFFAQSFPSLCLRLLPKQPTIFSPQIIENTKSWPTQPPGQPQLELLRQLMSHRIQEFNKKRRLTTDHRGSEGSDDTGSESKDSVLDTGLYHGHLVSAFGTWRSLPEPKQREQWHLEALRAFVREREEHEETKAKLGKQEAEMAHMRLQLNRLNECQQPREYLQFPPNRIELSKEAASAVGNTPDLILDTEKLITKWTAHVQTNTSFQRSLPVPAEQPETFEPMNGIEMMDPTEKQNTNGGAASSVHDEDDSEDAAGEDDDDLAGQASSVRAPQAPMDRTILDPNLRNAGADHVMEGIETDDGGFGNAGALLAKLSQAGEALAKKAAR